MSVCVHKFERIVIVGVLIELRIVRNMCLALFQCVNLAVHMDLVGPSQDFSVTPGLPVY